MNYKRSGISKTWVVDFILDEEGVRRIIDRLKQYGEKLLHPTSILIYVAQSGGFFYKTDDINEVLNDPNVSKKSIQRIIIELHDSSDVESLDIAPWKNNYIARINFDKTNKLKSALVVEHEDKGWSFLLAHDLESIVSTAFKTNQLSSITLIALWFTFSAFICVISQKTNFPFTIPIYIKWGGYILLAGLSFLFVRLVTFPRAKVLTKFFGPESTFFWGHQAVDYRKRENNRNYIKNTIIGGFLVSLLSSILLKVF